MDRYKPQLKLINHTSASIIKSKFFEIFCDFQGINHSIKCMNHIECLLLCRTYF